MRAGGTDGTDVAFAVLSCAYKDNNDGDDDRMRIKRVERS